MCYCKNRSDYICKDSDIINIVSRFWYTKRKHNHTNEDVINLSGINRNTLYRIKNAKQKGISIKTVERIKDYLDTFENIEPERTITVSHKTKVNVCSSKPNIQEKPQEETISKESLIKYEDKLNEIRNEMFIESYNKLLKPLGYCLDIKIVPIN